VQDQIAFVKVGLELYTAAGPEMVQRLITRGKRVFLDLKFLDIEETVSSGHCAGCGDGRGILNGSCKPEGAGRSRPRPWRVRSETVGGDGADNFDSQDLREMGIQRSVQDWSPRARYWRPSGL